MKRVIIVGGGFAGIRCARALAQSRSHEVLVLDRRNYHLFQPLLYQVAMAGLSPAEIASPIRTLLGRRSNVRVMQAEVTGVELNARRIATSVGSMEYDYLVLASGAQHAYFGNEQWEPHAPGLKTLEQATEIRRRVLSAFERAECERDPERRRALLTFVVVGGGPTGVELAGAIGEMSRFTLARDYRQIDPKLTRIVLLEAGPRVLSSFEPSLSSHAARQLEQLGVQIWTNSRVTDVSAQGVSVGTEHLAAATVLWAAGVKASSLGQGLGERDRQGRVHVTPELTLPDRPEVFVVGDLAHSVMDGAKGPLPAVATVAIQQGLFVARALKADAAGVPRPRFKFSDRGQMATIGRRRAIMQRGGVRASGTMAWLMWLGVHIYYLSGFRNRLIVLLQWAWSYLTFSRGARLIVGRDWRSYPGEPADGSSPELGARVGAGEAAGAAPQSAGTARRGEAPQAVLAQRQRVAAAAASPPPSRPRPPAPSRPGVAAASRPRAPAPSRPGLEAAVALNTRGGPPPLSRPRAVPPPLPQAAPLAPPLPATAGAGPLREAAPGSAPRSRASGRIHAVRPPNAEAAAPESRSRPRYRPGERAPDPSARQVG